jgi:hypothetical protein
VTLPHCPQVTLDRSWPANVEWTTQVHPEFFDPGVEACRRLRAVHYTVSVISRRWRSGTHQRSRTRERLAGRNQKVRWNSATSSTGSS